MIQLNSIYQMDNLELMRSMETGSVDVIYADPPYSTGQIFKTKDGQVAFDDTYSRSELIEMLNPRLNEMQRILKDTGVLFLHGDSRFIHHLRVLVADVYFELGGGRLINEIIYAYRGGNASKKFREKHDTILVYGKTNKAVLNVDRVRVPYNTDIIKITKEDDKGRYYTTGQNESGKVYLDPRGQLLYDVWTDIPSMTTSHGAEFTGYPTQKIYALLERILKCSLPMVDGKYTGLVLDPFAGAGTTLKVAMDLGVDWIGCDNSPVACEYMQKRLGQV